MGIGGHRRKVMIDMYALELENQKLKDRVHELEGLVDTNLQERISELEDELTIQTDKLSDAYAFIDALNDQVKQLSSDSMDDDDLQIAYSEYVDVTKNAIIWDPTTQTYKRRES
jgi:predicted nuclease with TOPRIM domain